jgi:hypothetical protein
MAGKPAAESSGDLEPPENLLDAAGGPPSIACPGVMFFWVILASGWLPGQSGEQAKVQRQGAGAPKNRQDRVHAFALPDASGYDQPSEPPTGIQHEILAVLFRVFATWRAAVGYSPDDPGLAPCWT